MKRIVLTLAVILALLAGPTSGAFAAGNGEIAYRALMIGIDSYQTNALSGCVNDASRMAETLLTANDAGAFYQSPTIRSNLQTDEISALFKEIQVWGTDDDDVTMFYFAGHGYMSDKGNPAIVGKDNKMLRITDLITLLDGVAGIKLVVFDCRYAESLVTDSNPQNALEVFDASVVDTFKNASTSADYYVLCASTLSKPQTDQAVVADGYGLATYYLTEGCGYDYMNKSQLDSMPADINDNGAVSFGEIQDYISENIKSKETGAIFDIKTFPSSSAYPILARRATTEVVKVLLPESQMDIAMGKKIELEATVQPSNASMRSIYWTSSDLSVAGVDDMGNVEGYKPGNAIISVTTMNGLTESMVVTVKNVIYADTLMMNLGKLVLAPNGRAGLSVTAEPSDASEDIRWSSQDPSIASVDQNGNVTCLKTGETVISASTDSGVEAVCALTVIEANKVVKAVEFAKTEYDLYVGENKTVQYVIKPKSAADTTIDLVSSDPEVANVSGSNIINAVAPGECVVYATASNGVTTSIDVSVKNATVALNKTSLSLKKGKMAVLKADVKPANSGKSITWSSSDPAVATVANGRVKGVASGQAVITASMDDAASANCTVIVDGVAVKNIKVRPQKSTVKAGETTQFTATVAPQNATIPACTWKSNKEDIAIVDENGLVTGVSAGTAIITAKSHNGKKAKAMVKVTGTAPAAVTNDTSTDTPADTSTGFVFEQPEVELVAGLAGENKLTISVMNDGAAVENSSLKWASSNPKVASVDKKGVVTAKSAGTTTVKALGPGKKTASCTVTVTENKVVNKTPFTGADKKLYTSARRIHYKNAATLEIEVYFDNKTGQAVKAPEAGKLVLLLTDGQVLDVLDIKAGTKKLKAGKTGVVTYRVKVKEGDALYGLNLEGAAAEIVKEGETPLQTVTVAQDDGLTNEPIVDTANVPAPVTDTPANVDESNIDDSSFIDDPFGTDDDWSNVVPNTEDFEKD